MEQGLLGNSSLLDSWGDIIREAPLPATVPGHAQHVRENAIRRRLEQAEQKFHDAHREGRALSELRQYAQELVDAAEDDAATDARRIGDTLDQLLDEISARGDGEMPDFIPTGFRDLDDLLNGGLKAGQMVIVAARPGVGKALALDTPLATDTGWTTMGQVQVGDHLIGPDGKPTTVTAATTVMTDRPCYEVTFSDGTKIVADAEHQWVTQTRKERRTKEVPSIRTTEQISATLRTKTKDRRLNHSVTNTKPLAGVEQHLIIKPYTLGAWLGDGHTSGSRITSPDQEVLDRISQDGYRVNKTSAELAWSIRMPDVQPSRTCHWCGNFSPSCYRKACSECYSGLGTFTGRLRLAGVLGNKHIPSAYLRSSESQRRELLAGLMDTDGTVTRGGAYQICLTSKPLALNVYELIVSLGYRCGWAEKRVCGRCEETSTAYIMTFSTPRRIFSLSRKNDAHVERRKANNTTRSNSRFITEVKKIESVPVRCVQVDNESHMYLAGESMVPTHNSTLALDIMREMSIRRGEPSLLFSLEMTEDEVQERALSAEAQVKIGCVKSGNMSEAEWTRVAAARDTITEAPLWVDDNPELTMVDITAKAKLAVRHHGVRLIAIDYLQLLKSGAKEESRQQEVSSFSRQIKLLAKSCQVPVIAIAQLNRGVENRGDDATPKPSDLRESGSLEQDADLVLLINRPDAQNKDHERAGEADIIVAKNRGGATGTVTVASQLHYSRFTAM